MEPDGRFTERSADILAVNRQPILMVTNPPYGIELDSEWRDRAGLNGYGPAGPSYPHRDGDDALQAAILAERWWRTSMDCFVPLMTMGG